MLYCLVSYGAQLCELDLLSLAILGFVVRVVMCDGKFAACST